MNTRDAIRAMMDKNKVVGNCFEDKLKFVYFDGTVFRKDNYQQIDINNIMSDEWKLYEEPKKTKIICEYLIESKGTKDWFVCGYLYTEEEASTKFSGSKHIKTGRQFEVEA